jgi:ABC-2 type transport system permease protein
MSQISRILTDIKYSLVQFFRSKQSVFFAFAFPVIFLVVLGFLLGGQSGPQTLYYSDSDGSQASIAFIASLNVTTGLSMADGSGMDLAQKLNDGQISAYMEIPKGFGNNASGSGIKVYYDKYKAASSAIVAAVQQAVDQFNMGSAGAGEIVTLSSQDVTTSSTNYIDFLLPGILGLCIMFSALNEAIGVVSKYKANGIFSKLSMTPMSTIEWNVSRIISGTIIVMLSVLVSLVVARLAFGVMPAINILSILLVIVGSVMFSGLGMIVAYLIDETLSPTAVSLTISLPLMLVSGSLFPTDQLPFVLGFFSVLSPLTPLNNGLRSAMFTGNTGDAIVCLLISIALSFILFAIGVAILMGKEEKDG